MPKDAPVAPGVRPLVFCSETRAERLVFFLRHSLLSELARRARVVCTVLSKGCSCCARQLRAKSGRAFLSKERRRAAPVLSSASALRAIPASPTLGRLLFLPSPAAPLVMARVPVLLLLYCTICAMPEVMRSLAEHHSAPTALQPATSPSVRVLPRLAGPADRHIRDRDHGRVERRDWLGHAAVAAPQLPLGPAALQTVPGRGRIALPELRPREGRRDLEHVTQVAAMPARASPPGRPRQGVPAKPSPPGRPRQGVPARARSPPEAPAKRFSCNFLLEDSPGGTPRLRHAFKEKDDEAPRPPVPARASLPKRLRQGVPARASPSGRPAKGFSYAFLFEGVARRVKGPGRVGRVPYMPE